MGRDPKRIIWNNNRWSFLKRGVRAFVSVSVWNASGNCLDCLCTTLRERCLPPFPQVNVDLTLEEWQFGGVPSVHSSQCAHIFLQCCMHAHTHTHTRTHTHKLTHTFTDISHSCAAACHTDAPTSAFEGSRLKHQGRRLRMVHSQLC